MDCKFNIGDYVYYRGNKPSDIYLVVGRTEYSRKKTIYCGKDRLVHEPTYELINIFYTKDRIIKDIADIYGIPMFSNCREHHMTLKESKVGNIHTIPFKFNLNDYVTLKKGTVAYKITSRTEWLDGCNPTYELMRITKSEHVYFEYYSEELINEKICIKEVVDNFKKMCYELCEEECKKLEEDMKNMDRNNEKLYLCDPNKNIECTKTDCGHLGTGKCFCTTNKDYMADGYLIEVKTNQDKLAEMVRTMDAHKLALLITDGIECPNCPAEKYCDQHICTTEDGWERVPDKNGELLDCNQIFERWLKEEV